MQAAANGENAWRAPGGGSQSNNGLRASAPIWTPKQKSTTKSTTNGFNSVNSSETMLIPKFQNNSNTNTNAMMMSGGGGGGGWSNNSWSGSVSPMSYPMQSPPMPMMPMTGGSVQGGGLGSPHGGSSPSSPGTGVFLPSSLGSSRRPSQGGSVKGGFLHGSSPPRRFNLAVNQHDVGVSHISTTQCHTSAISLPDELF